MIKILEMKGKQESETDYSFVLDEGVLKYQNKIQAGFKSNDCKLEKKFPKTNKGILNLLKAL